MLIRQVAQLCDARRRKRMDASRAGDALASRDRRGKGSWRRGAHQPDRDIEVPEGDDFRHGAQRRLADEINLEKVATNSGALYLNATDPAELKRLYDSIGKQLAGQYTIYYTSNLPSDGLEHRVQPKFGAATSTKSFVPPARVAAAPPTPAPTAKKPAESPADLPDWLALYPGSKPEGISVVIDPKTGKRVGSYFFRTSDEIKQVHDFYEDNMTKATWEVSRAPTRVWGSSEAEGRKFEVTSERRGYARTLIYEPFDFDAEYARAFVGEEPGDPPARFASIPALIQMKKAAGRPSDLIDIDKLQQIAQFTKMGEEKSKR
jgi:hypothetical protein